MRTAQIHICKPGFMKKSVTVFVQEGIIKMCIEKGIITEDYEGENMLQRKDICYSKSWKEESGGVSAVWKEEVSDTNVIVFYWLGQMGFIIKSAHTTLCIDYYASPDELRQTPIPIPAEDLKGIDAFLGTHDHIDHIDHESWRIWAKTNPKAKFIFPAAHRNKVIEDGVRTDQAVGVNAGESLQIGDMKIHAIPAAHEFLDQDEKTGLYPYLQYIIEACGVRIHHAGDTVRYEGMMGKISSFGKIDVQILPINGRDANRYRNNLIGNMTYQEAVDLAGECGSRIAIPGHWDMFAENSADPYEFADYLDVKYCGTTRCLIPKIMEKIELKSQQSQLPL